jgi:uncharacterized protein (TIGR03083 family)
MSLEANLSARATVRNQAEGSPMTDHSASRKRIRRGNLHLTTAGTCDLDPERLVNVFDQQRRRFVAVLQEFGPEDWAAPTRCADWSAHEVVRHLCDGTAVAASAGPDDRTLDIAAGFDPRTTPSASLAASAGESPDATFRRFTALTAQALTVLRTRLARDIRYDVRLPYGPMDWTILVLHVFWDSWLHERDVLLARGRDHPTDGDATHYATAYGLFLAAAVAAMFGDPVQQKLALAGDGGGVFALESRSAVTLTVTRATTAGPAAAQVADALAGRAETGTVLSEVPPGSRSGLSHLADFFNSPVQPSQA